MSQSLDKLQEWLDSYLNFEKLPQKNIFWLDTMEFLCQKMNNPHLALPTIHLAGSKGKGSTSVMVASILEAAGYKAGLYTSPHILDFSERVGTAFGPLPESVYQRATKLLMERIKSIPSEEMPGGRPLTWFELVTIFAFIAFKEGKLDWAVFETGLGGRLDATNVLQPKISVITPIELEHTEFLGDSLEKIATEKAGIIKAGTPVVIGPQKTEANRVLEAKAQEGGCQVYQVSKLVEVTGKLEDTKMKVCLQSKMFSRPLVTNLSMLGDYQMWNAATAALTAKILLPNLTEEAIERGLSQAKLPGRFEVVQWNKTILVLDGAHTPNSLSLSLKTFWEYFGAKKSNNQAAPLSIVQEIKPHLLFACAADKDVKTIARLFTGFSPITLTRPGEEKQSNGELLQEAFCQAGQDFTYYQDFRQAIEKALNQAQKENAPLLVTGSFYLVAEVKKWLQGDLV